MDRRSLRWRLPLLFALVAIVTVGTFGVVAYREVRASSLQASATRLQSALGQVKALSETGLATLRVTLEAAAGNPGIVEALRYPERPLGTSARAALEQVQGQNDTLVTVELLDPTGGVRYMVRSDRGPTAHEPSAEFTPNVTFSPFHLHDGHLTFEEVVAVRAGNVVLGGIHVTRRILGTVSRRTMAGLLGEDAGFLFGNSDGTVWEDTGSIQYPLDAPLPVRYTRAGAARVSAAIAMDSAPWMFVADLPERIALRPARGVIVPFVVAGALIALGGMLLGLRVSRRITTPLADLTAAAEAMSRGEREVHRMPVHRSDELGRLARAFRAMAVNVRGVEQGLADAIDARTAELTHTNEQLRRLERGLQQTERLATLGWLSGSVGHELRNPLGVMSNVVTLLDTLPDQSSRLKGYTDLLREQIRLSDRIISDLLDRARSGAPMCSGVDLPRLLEDTLTRTDLPSAVTVQRDIAPSLPQVMLDRDQVGQILWNVIRNAVQEMDGSGVLSVGVCQAGDRVRISIRDSGPGIEAADRERVFEPMYTTKSRGVGLGLSISRAFARANGGDLFVEPDGRQGACFVLDLPSNPAPEEDVPGGRVEIPAASPV